MPITTRSKIPVPKEYFTSLLDNPRSSSLRMSKESKSSLGASREEEMSVPRVIVNTQQTNIEGSNMTAAQSALSSVKKFQNSQSGDALSFIKLFERAMGIMKVRDDAMKIHWLGTRLTAEASDWFSDYYETN